MVDIHILRKQVAGALFPRYSRFLDVVNRNALLRHWIKAQTSARVFPNRQEYFEYINKEHLSNGPIQFLEFGVYEGDSLKEWTELNSHPDSRFVGFDTFGGLPEHWNVNYPVGTFDVAGKLPDINDSRVSFEKGLFQDTLGPFVDNFEKTGSLIVHVDSSIYSSALFVLTKLDTLLADGATVMFDEFSSPLHEFRAFQDYVAAYRRDYRTIAAVAPYFHQTAILFGPNRPAEPTGTAAEASNS